MLHEMLHQLMALNVLSYNAAIGAHEKDMQWVGVLCLVEEMVQQVLNALGEARSNSLSPRQASCCTSCSAKRTLCKKLLGILQHRAPARCVDRDDRDGVKDKAQEDEQAAS